MATHYKEWNQFKDNCLHPENYMNGEITIGDAKFLVEDKQASVEPSNGIPETEAVFIGGETVNTPLYYANLAILLAQQGTRIRFLNLPNEAKNLNQAVEKIRAQIARTYRGSKLPIKILGKSMGGYILARLAFHDDILDDLNLDSLYFDTPALTGRIYSPKDANEFRKRCKAADDYGLLTSGNRLSSEAYQEIFGSPKEEALDLHSTSRPTSGFVPALAAKGLLGQHSEITHNPGVEVHINAKIKDTVINIQMLDKRAKALAAAGVEVHTHYDDQDTRHLDMPGLNTEQIKTNFPNLFQ